MRVLSEFTAIEGIQVLTVPPGRDVATLIQRYRASGLVDFAEPDLLGELAASPNDEYYTAGLLWHLHNYGQNSGKVDADIDAPEGWDTLTSATNVLVAIVDSGVRQTHEDLVANLWVNPGEIPGNGVDDDNDGYVDDVHGINALLGTGQPIDTVGHGTMVAGLIGGLGNNGVGVTGVAWRAKLMPCRCTDDAGGVSLSSAIKGLDFARAKGANLINASFVFTSYSSSLYAAINSCRTAGIIVVAAAGNGNGVTGYNIDSTPSYPASYDLDNLVAVAATTRGDLLAGYSSYGANSVDLAAPGTDIYSAWHSADNAYSVNRGTSFSAPIVTGAFALLRARYPTVTYRQLINQVLRTTDPLSPLTGKCVTGGRLNLARALDPAVTARFNPGPIGGVVPLTVRFTNLSLGLPSSLVWDFGDGTTSTIPDPVHTYATPSNYVVSLTLTAATGTVSVTNRTVVALLNYGITNTAFGWVDPAEMASLNVTGDAVSSGQTLPFRFRFYGEDFDTFFVSANGLLGFATSSLNSTANTDLPNANAPNGIVCPFWDDLNPVAGSVRYGVTGTAPGRKAVVSWVAAAGLGNPSIAFSFQAILEETSNDIVFQYLDVEPDNRNNSAAGRTATIGIEQRSGLVAVRHSYNGSNLLTNGQAIRFVAPSSDTTNPPPQAVTLLQPIWDAGTFHFSFNSVAERIYEAQFVEQLGETNWQTLGTLNGTGGLMSFTNVPPATTPRFYRIESK